MTIMNLLALTDASVGFSDAVVVILTFENPRSLQKT